MPKNDDVEFPTIALSWEKDLLFLKTEMSITKWARSSDDSFSQLSAVASARFSYSDSSDPSQISRIEKFKKFFTT